MTADSREMWPMLVDQMERWKIRHWGCWRKLVNVEGVYRIQMLFVDVGWLMRCVR